MEPSAKPVPPANALRSTGAVLAGFATGAVLSVGMDALMLRAGWMTDAPFSSNPAGVVLVVLAYRFVFNVTGCYLTAALAPRNPMKHALFIGIIGTLLAIAGSAVMWDKAVAWYNITIIFMSLPSAWLGGRLYLNRKNRNTNG